MPPARYNPFPIYEALVIAYRREPEAHVLAARAARCDTRTARKFWERGVKGHEADYPPICDVVKDEQAVAKAARERARQATKVEEAERSGRAESKAAREENGVIAGSPEVKDLVANDAARTKAALAKLCEAARGVSLGNFSIIASELKAVAALTERINADLAALHADPWQDVEKDGDGNVTKRRRYTVREMLDIQHQVVRASSMTTRAAFSALQMERLHMGLPTEIIGVEDMTLEEAIREIETANAELQQAKERGLVLIAGGKTGA